MTRILCVHLKQWPIDRQRRRQRRLRLDASRPLALIRSVTNRRTVQHVCLQAAAGGVRLGMSLVEACSLCESLEHLEAEPEKDARALERLGQWLVRFSPVVALQPPDAIALDVTGSERLFGSQERLLALVHRALASLQIRIAVATAPTLGAAWAVAFSLDRGRRVVEPDQLRLTLEPLKIAALRIEEPTVLTLYHLGVKTIGQLLRLPRSTLPSRFGSTVLQQIDQALGMLPEPLVALAHVEPIVATLAFEGKIDAFETLEYAAGQLLNDVLPTLHRRGQGARTVHLDLLREKLPCVRKTIALSQPSRVRRLLMNLLRCSLETVESDEGFIGVRLEVVIGETVVEPQLSLFDQQEQIGRLELVHLVERLRLRLGEDAVQGGMLIESHVPERAAKRVMFDLSAKVLPVAPTQQPRPLRLFRQPIEIRCIVTPSTDEVGEPATVMLNSDVYRVIHAVGPERITGVWWEGRHKTRDYYDVELPDGRRWWIFQVQENRRWFWHGEF